MHYRIVETNPGKWLLPLDFIQSIEFIPYFSIHGGLVAVMSLMEVDCFQRQDGRGGSMTVIVMLILSVRRGEFVRVGSSLMPRGGCGYCKD